MVEERVSNFYVRGGRTFASLGKTLRQNIHIGVVQREVELHYSEDDSNNSEKCDFLRKLKQFTAC